VAVGYFLFVAQYLQLVLGLTPLEAGLWSLPSAIGFIVGSNAAPRIVRLVRPGIVMGTGLALAAFGLALLTQVDGPNGLAVVVAGSVIISLGLAPVLSLTTELIVGSAPPEKAGAASGISETGAELGGALGISILGSIGVALYRGRIGDALPASIPDAAADVARDTLGGAVGVAEQLPDPVGSALLAVARGAFVDGMQVAAAISAVVAIIVAGLALALLRGIPPRDDGERTEEERPRADLRPSAAPVPDA
jgi:DHA2 family multidrug resistance protein-like MFS transporter